MLEATADGTWDPPKGRLFIREMTEPDGEEVERVLGFATETRAGDRLSLAYKTIALARSGHVSPNFARYIDGAVGVECRSGMGLIIRRRLATDEDVAAIIRGWKPESRGCPLDGWLRDVCSARMEPGLDEDEKARLVRIFTEVTGRTFERPTEGR